MCAYHKRIVILYLMIYSFISCDMFYIGRTGRALIETFKIHLPKSNLNTVKSNNEKHLMIHNHKYTHSESNWKPLYV